MPAGTLMLLLPPRGGNFYLGPERGLHKADRHLANQIITVALKNIVRLDVQHHIQITGGTTAKAGFAIA